MQTQVSGEFTHVHDHETAMRAAVERPEVVEVLGEVRDLWQRGEIDLAAIGGFTSAELGAAQARVTSLISAGMPAKALKLLGALLLLRPNCAAYHLLSGLAFHHLREYDLASDAYELALSLAPDDPVAQMYCAETSLHLGKTTEGAAMLRRGIVAASGQPELYPIVNRARAVARAFTITID